MNEEIQRNITQSVSLNKDNVNKEDQLKKKVVVEDGGGNYNGLIKNKGVASSKVEEKRSNGVVIMVCLIYLEVEMYNDSNK